MKARIKGDIHKALKDLERKLYEKLDSVCGQYAEELRKEAIANLDKNKTNNTGDLRKSIIARRIRPMLWRVRVGEKYGVFVEFGTKPHFPPPLELQRWAKRKLGLSHKEARKAGWAIAVAISKRGTRAQPFIRPAIEKIRPLFINAIHRAIKSL